MVVRILMSGQSNALGRGTGGPDFSGVDNSVRIWNNVNPLGSLGSAFVTAVSARSAGTFENNDTNNMGVWFASRLGPAVNDTVRMVLAARGATAISAWSPGNSVGMFEYTVNAWKAAYPSNAADIFIWHQGEGNTSTAPTSYISSFRNLIQNLKNQGVLNNNTKILLGGLSPDNTSRIAFNVNVLEQMSLDYPDSFYADSFLTTTYDGTHFDGPSLYTMGNRNLYNAYLESNREAGMAIFALVNDGGTPGQAGSGNLRRYNLDNLKNMGLGSRNINSAAATISGTTLSSAMAAAGSIVAQGQGSSGLWVKWQSGLMICVNDVTLTYSTNSNINNTWTYPQSFTASPFVIVSGKATGTTASTASRSVAWLDAQNPGTTQVNIRATSNNGFSTGENFAVYALAIGFFK